MATALHPATLSDNGPSRSTIYTRVYHNGFDGQPSPKDPGQASYSPVAPSPRLARPSSMNFQPQPPPQPYGAPQGQPAYDDYRQSAYREPSQERDAPWEPPAPSRPARQSMADDSGYGPPQQQQQPPSYAPDPRASQHEAMAAYIFPPPDRPLAHAPQPRRATGPLARHNTDDTLTRVPADVDPADADALDDAEYARRTSYAPPPRERERERPLSAVGPSAPRHPALPSAGASSTTLQPIIPMSAAPSYAPPAVVNVSPKHRAYAQQPTYVNPGAPSPSPMNMVYAPAPPPMPQEEVCVECAMRDKDMADVDVTSPGIWERESDAAYFDLVRREQEEEEAGIARSHDSSQPRSTGDLLTEGNLKYWLSINPKEPTSRQQTLNAYVRSQRQLLEAEALAHAQTMAEARQREAYAQLRRSAYDVSNNGAADSVGSLRVKSPRSLSMPTNGSPLPSPREVTVLENGLIVEHVDVKKEERDRRKEERRERSRARKSSRSSGAEVHSVYSQPQSPIPQHQPSDSGYYSSLRPNPRNSQFSPSRPQSVLSTGEPQQRPGIPRAYSQYSLAESTQSPRRSRFFGKSFNSGWKSQDSLAFSGVSGSMVDMHLALNGGHSPYPNEMGSNVPTMRRGDPRLSEVYADAGRHQQEEEKAAKKKKGLAKIWRIVTGQSRAAGARAPERTRSLERAEDDGPLAPPPPLTYLMSRSTGEPPRHAPAPSMASGSSGYQMASPGMCASPATAPSSLLPSPVSSRKSGPDVEHEPVPFVVDERNAPMHNSRTMLSEPDMRDYRSSMLVVPTDAQGRPAVLKREKSLPPLPHEMQQQQQVQARPYTATHAESRPATMFYDPRGMVLTASPESPSQHGLGPPQAPFRTADARRQSFGGMSSRPDLGLQTLPMSAGGYGNGQLGRASPQPYGEFGMSRRSLGRLDDLTSYESSQQAATAPRKRRSKFALSTLFGKKTSGGHGHGREPSHNGPAPVQALGYPHDYAMQPGSSVEHDYGSVRGRTTSMVPRMSVASRKAIEELVEQDRDFVAYRYPSNDQMFGVAR